MSARRVRRDPRRKWRRLAGFAAAFLAVVVAYFAWTLFADGPDDSEPTTSPTTTSTVPEPTGPRLLDPGAEPRQVLRLEFAEGEEISFRTVSDLDVTQVSGDQEQVVDTPGVIQTATLTIDSVHLGGAEAAISFEITGASVFPDGRFPEQTVNEMNLGLASLVGIGGSGRIADTGEVLSFEYGYTGDSESVQSTLDQLAGQIESLTPSFPTEPVGLGARWEVDTAAQVSGVAFSQVTTYELTDMSEGTIDYTSTVTQTAEPQDLDLPDTENARLTSYSGAGEGSGVFMLTSLVASGTTTVTGSQEIVLTPAGGTEVEVTQELIMELVVEVVW